MSEFIYSFIGNPDEAVEQKSKKNNSVKFIENTNSLYKNSHLDLETFKSILLKKVLNESFSISKENKILFRSLLQYIGVENTVIPDSISRFNNKKSKSIAYEKINKNEYHLRNISMMDKKNGVSGETTENIQIDINVMDSFEDNIIKTTRNSELSKQDTYEKGGLSKKMSKSQSVVFEDEIDQRNIDIRNAEINYMANAEINYMANQYPVNHTDPEINLLKRVKSASLSRFSSNSNLDEIKNDFSKLQRYSILPSMDYWHYTNAKKQNPKKTQEFSRKIELFMSKEKGEKYENSIRKLEQDYSQKIEVNKNRSDKLKDSLIRRMKAQAVMVDNSIIETKTKNAFRVVEKIWHIKNNYCEKSTKYDRRRHKIKRQMLLRVVFSLNFFIGMEKLKTLQNGLHTYLIVKKASLNLKKMLVKRQERIEMNKFKESLTTKSVANASKFGDILRKKSKTKSFHTKILSNFFFIQLMKKKILKRTKVIADKVELVMTFFKDSSQCFGNTMLRLSCMWDKE